MTSPAIAIHRTPIEQWIAQRVGASHTPLSRAAIAEYQLAKLRETIQWARQHSPFYSRQLRNFDDSTLSSLDELRLLPFTTGSDLAESSSQFVCVSQDEIARVVTLSSSGTSGDPKRLFFTAADQERTLDFFEHGVSTLASRGEKMLIALPSERHGSVGNLLALGIQRSGVQPIPYGIIGDPIDALKAMDREGATSIIGFPVQLLRLASQRGRLADRVLSRLRSIVLCSDHVSQSIVRRLVERTGCEVFEHYGMTETGLGGGVDCEAHQGYHLREADLFFEIIDPGTGHPVPDGEPGEVVFTTLTRAAMPLIRYRTGDLSCFASEPCACGTVLKNLQRVRDRVDSEVSLGGCGRVTISELDDVLFAVPGLIDFAVSVTAGKRTELRIVCQLFEADESAAIRTAHASLIRNILPVARGLQSGELRVQVKAASQPFIFRGAKRRIEVHTDR